MFVLQNAIYSNVSFQRRCKDLRAKGIYFIGTGVSGGETGARFGTFYFILLFSSLIGPSLMPGGAHEAWESVKPIFQAVAAKADGEPCCDWVGADGSGHFVKMVHNGIEYGDMQLIAEAYHLMLAMKMEHDDMANVCCFLSFSNTYYSTI
jgi:6-phosphogluconate dehydrogenase